MHSMYTMRTANPWYIFFHSIIIECILCIPCVQQTNGAHFSILYWGSNSASLLPMTQAALWLSRSFQHYNFHKPKTYFYSVFRQCHNILTSAILVTWIVRGCSALSVLTLVTTSEWNKSRDNHKVACVIENNNVELLPQYRMHSIIIEWVWL